MRKKMFANPDLADLPVEIKPRPWRHLVFGNLFRLVTLLVPVAVILLAVLLILKQQSTIFGLLTPVLLFLTVYVMMRTFRLSNRYLVNPQRKLKLDSRPPILYLRSFHNDPGEIPGRLDKKTPEEILASCLQEFGPVVAIGTPNEEGLPLLGATRLYVTEAGEKWQEVVQRLMSLSQVIVIHAGTSPGVEWEMKAMRHVVPPEKLLITCLLWQENLNRESVVPQTDRHYAQFSKHFREAFDRDLPPYDMDTSFVYFDSHWTPTSLKIEPVIMGADHPLPFLAKSGPSIPVKRISAAVLSSLYQRGVLNPSDARQLSELESEFNSQWLFLSTRGRVRRKTFWVRLLPGIVLFLVIVIAVVLCLLLSDRLSNALIDFLVVSLLLLILLAGALPFALIALTVKRVQDFNVSGWVAAFSLVPWIGILVILVLGMIKGSSGANRFGSKGY